MNRIIAFIENDMYVRNFITSGAFDLLMQRDDFAIALAENIKRLRDAIPPERVCGIFKRNPVNINLIYNFNQVSMRALRHKSTTFDIKARVNWFGPKDPSLFKPTYSQQEMENIRQQILNSFQRNPSVEAIIQAEQPELVIFPITGVEATGTELIQLSQPYNFKTLFLVNGWDNLSSKGVFPTLPDYLGVWGPQSMLDAVEIQGMPFEGIHLLGCSRYEDYFVAENAAEKIFDFKYALFAGACTPCDEITPLRRMDSMLSQMGVQDFKIVYRPHPWRNKRECFDSFEPEKYAHTIIDPQVSEGYFGEKARGTESCSSQNYPELKYYPSLINHTAFVISPMSSMLLEAALFDVPAIVLAYDDGVHAIPASAQARFKHFEGAENIPGWFFVHEAEEIEPVFEHLVAQLREDSPESRTYRPVLSHAMKKYLHEDGLSYAQRLYLTVEQILLQQDQALVAHLRRKNRWAARLRASA